MTKISNIDILLMTQTVEKSYPLGPQGSAYLFKDATPLRAGVRVWARPRKDRLRPGNKEENLFEQVKQSTLKELPCSQQGNKIYIKEVHNGCFRLK